MGIHGHTRGVHHREPDRPDAPAHSVGGNRSAGQPIAAQTAPRNTPGLSAPKRKACSQKQAVCPRKLWQTSCLSLHASRLAAACRLRQSGRRVRGPVSLPRPGCPVCRSRHPAALPPPFESFAPQGADPGLLLGARLARGGAPAKEGRGRCPQDPLYCARDFSRRIPAANAIAQSQPSFRTPTVFPKEPR